jgi:S-adenosylmethionine/arginine decarboxylase-like enzyme
MSYGMRIEIEGFDVRPGIGSITGLDDEEYIKRFLLAMIKAAGMKLAIGPLVYREPQRDSEGKGPGLTGMAVLIESHVVIHTYPEQRWFLFELLSCKKFDPDAIVSEVNEWFSCQGAVEVKKVGEHFPES